MSTTEPGEPGEPSVYAGPTIDDLKAATGFHARYHLIGGTTSCHKWRLNGRIQTWKRDANRVRIPVKFGLYSYDAITQSEVGNKTLFAFTGKPDDKCPFCGSAWF